MRNNYSVELSILYLKSVYRHEYDKAEQHSHYGDTFDTDRILQG